MKTFLQIDKLYRHEINFSNEGEFTIIQIQTSYLKANRLLFNSNKLRVPNYLINNLFSYIKYGDPLLCIKRVEFIDSYKSFMIIFDNRRQIIIRTYNLIKNEMDEFNLKNINTDEFATLFEG